MEISTLESKYKYKYSKFFKQLWDDGMIDWMNGRTAKFSTDETWENTIYPKINLMNFGILINIHLFLLLKQKRALFMPFIRT